MASGSASTRSGAPSTKESRAARRSKLLRGSKSTFQTSNPNAPNYSPF